MFTAQYRKRMLLSSLQWSSYNDEIMVSAETKTLIHSISPLLEIAISEVKRWCFKTNHLCPTQMNPQQPT